MADLIDRDEVLHDVSNECSKAHEAKYYEAQVALTRAKRIIRDAPAVNRWISVKDALPDDRKCVLVTDGEDIEITFFDGSDWEMRDQYGNHYEMYGAVTHWMPLPEPPEVNSDAD